MSSTFVNLVSPIGTGPAVDVSGLSAIKNLSVSGLVDGILIVEGSIDGSKYAPILQVSPPPDGFPQNVSFRATVKWLRTNRIRSASSVNPTIAVGGQVVTDFASSALSVPAVGGFGTALDVSAYGNNKSLVLGGNYDGLIALYGSQDGTSFDSITTFIQAGQEVAFFEGVYKFVRLQRVAGAVGGGEVPSVSIAGVSNPAAAVTPSNLAATYAAGTNAASQTLVLLDATGGGVIIDATNAGFGPMGTPPPAWTVKGLLNPYGISVNKVGNVGFGTNNPQRMIHIMGGLGWGSDPIVRMQSASGLGGNFDLSCSDTTWSMVSNSDGGFGFCFKVVSDAGIPFGAVPGIQGPHRIAAHDMALLDAAGGSTDKAFVFGAGSTAAVSSANGGTIRYNESLQRFERSENGGAYSAF